MVKICVVGAGVVGLSTAVHLQEEYNNSVVTVIAEKFFDQTCSFGAAGIFRSSPNNVISRSPQSLRILKTSWEHYDRLAHSDEACDAGVQILSVYFFTDQADQDLFEPEYAYNHRELTHKELNTFPGQKYRHGFFTTTLLIEPPRYLPYLIKKFQARNGLVVKRKLNSLKELLGHYDLVINCTGLGAQSLCEDKDVYPIRGHLIKVRAPWVKHAIYSKEGFLSYIIPGLDVVSIGGTKVAHDYEKCFRKSDTETLMRNACEIMPSLKNAEVLYEWVGLRPARKKLRIDTEVIREDGKVLKVVHNYGHGSEGITLSWGTAVEAVKLVRKLTELKASF